MLWHKIRIHYCWDHYIKPLGHNIISHPIINTVARCQWLTQWRRWCPVKWETELKMFYDGADVMQGRAGLSSREIMLAGLDWLIPARQGSNPARTDLYRDKLEQETSLQQPGTQTPPPPTAPAEIQRCIFQLSRAAASISWLNVIVNSIIIVSQLQLSGCIWMPCGDVFMA